MDRNKRPVYYSLFEGNRELRDDQGRLTGEYNSGYGAVIPWRVNHSPASGTVAIELFGELPEYSKVLVTSDTQIPFDEQTRFWIDTNPNLDDAGQPTTPHDYVVYKIADSLNVHAVALKRVTVRG